MSRVVCVLVLVALAGCPHDVRVGYPSDPTEPTGSVILVFTKAPGDVTVAVNGLLVVDGAHARKVRIDGIPTGTARIAVAAGPGQQQLEVWVSSDNPTTIPLGNPGQSGGDWLKSVFASIATIIVYSLLN